VSFTVVEDPPHEYNTWRRIEIHRSSWFLSTRMLEFRLGYEHDRHSSSGHPAKKELAGRMRYP
jgi:hypothetical protein